MNTDKRLSGFGALAAFLGAAPGPRLRTSLRRSQKAHGAAARPAARAGQGTSVVRKEGTRNIGVHRCSSVV